MTTKPKVSQLGAQTPVPTSPEAATLERVQNPHADTNYVARFVCPEFTSLCPVTGQPDFGPSSSIMCRINAWSSPNR